MSLLAAIKKDEEALKAAQEAEGTVEEDEELDETVEDDKEEAEEKDDKKEEKDAEEDEAEKKADKTDDKTKGKDDKKEAPGETKGNAAARLRIAEKLRKDAEKQLELERAKKAEPAKAEPKKEDAAALTVEEEVKQLKQEKEERERREANTRLHNDAIAEFNDYEAEFTKVTPDYEPASDHMVKAMVDGVLKAYPTATEKQALAHVQKQVLQIAGRAVKNGQNPVEVLYNMSYERYGYNPRAPKKDAVKDKVANLKNVDKNKKRSATALSGGGQTSSSSVSLEEGANMSLSNFSNLSESEIDEMIEQAAG